MIVVTGATGQLGRQVVQQLVGRVPPAQIAATARDPERAADLAALGVAVRRGDFADPGALAAAFAGATQALVVSINQVGEPAHALHRAAIEAARAAGARRVLYTSHMGARADSPFAPAVDHAAAEAVLADGGAGGADGVALRHGFYAESALYLIGDGLTTGEIRAPEDGPVSWTARADLAEADAVLLADAARLDGVARGGATPPLTAGAALTLADVAAVASELTGREVRRTVVSDAAWRDAAVARGVPAPMAEMLLGTYQAARRGDFAAVDPTLAALLGRPPRAMRDVLRDVLAAAPAAGPGAGHHPAGH